MQGRVPAAFSQVYINPQEHDMNDAATPETATASESLDLHGAALAIERLMTPRRREAPEGNADAANEADDAGVADPGGEPADSEQPDDVEEPVEAAEPADQPHFTVKVDGETREVPLGELIRGYQRGADYTRKTMRLADERREVDEIRERLANEMTAAQQERDLYAERVSGALPALRQQLTQFDGIDWNRLAADDPALFAQARPAFEAIAAQLRQAEAEDGQLRERAQQRRLQQAETHRQFLADQKRALIERHPEMADPETGRRETAALTRYLVDSGYRQDELSRLIDHRDFVLARKAMLYDRLAGARDQIKETLAALPRVQRPGTARDRGPGAGQRRAAMMKRLRHSGRTEDAARLIEELL